MKNHTSLLSVAIAFVLVVTGYEAVVNGRAIGASLAPFVTTSCSSSSACIGGSNLSNGAGVLAASVNGRGINASTKHNSTSAATASYGVFGQDASTSGSFDSGVYGLSVRGIGVSGTSTNNAGVSGTSTNGVGASGSSTNNSGVTGTSTSGVGVVGIGSYGLEAIGSSGGAIYASTNGGDAIYANTNGTSVWGLVAQSPNGSGVQVTGGSRGVDSTGGYAGIVGRSTSYPIIAAAPTGAILFYVDSSGDVYYHGSLNTFGEPASGVRLYTAQSTAPAIEETGTAHLAFGRANVYFSPNFARSIEAQRGYQVFLTPDGDTRGLYVQGKYAKGFVVREVQGGRGNFDFDYRVHARGNESEPITPAAEPHLPPMLRATAPRIPPIPHHP